jgi:hypothetical protein
VALRGCGCRAARVSCCRISSSQKLLEKLWISRRWCSAGWRLLEYLGSVAAQGRGCRSSSVQWLLVQREAKATGSALIICSARPRPGRQAVRFSCRWHSAGRETLEQLGSGIADTARDEGCWSSSDQMPCLVFVCRSSSCPEWLETEAAGAAQRDAEAARAHKCQLLLVWHETDAAGAAQFSRGAILMLQERLGSVAAGAARVGCRWNS